MTSVIYRDDEILIALGGMPYVVAYDDPRYNNVCELLKNNDFAKLSHVLSTKHKGEKIKTELTTLGIEAVNNQYTYKGNPINMDLSKYLSDALERNVSVEPIAKFIAKLFNNPNYNTRQQLFTFMQKNGMPINHDGYFYAYKVVRSDYLDKHTGTMSNAPGSKLEITWAEVDTDPNVTCSHGLHCCSIEYCQSFYTTGDRLVCVKVDPANVGAVPVDYNGSKLRARAYEVLSDITDEWLRERNTMRLYTESGLNSHEYAQPTRVTREYF